MKTAIIYDWMDKIGGVERMLLILNEIFPEADWYTSYVDTKRAGWIEKLRKGPLDVARHDKVKTSFIAKFPSYIRGSRILSLPFYPYAFESFDLSDYDLVISITSSFAKGVITRPETKHLCILLTPTRWLWGGRENYAFGITNYELLRPFKLAVENRLRNWDYVAAQRPDKIIAISQTVAKRCKAYYQRNSEVIYPPFDMEYWSNLKFEMRNEQSNFQLPTSHFFLVVSRLESYKKVDLVIRAFNQLKDKQLVIIGKGTHKSKISKLAGENCIFLEDVSDQELARYYTHAQALIMPQEEDFGYVALEAQFFGCPVITYAKGGGSETVIDGKTGVFINTQTRDAIRDAVADFRRDTYNLDDIKRNLERFSKENFKNFILDCVTSS